MYSLPMAPRSSSPLVVSGRRSTASVLPCLRHSSPAQIINALRAQHAGESIVQIERKRRGYKVELSSGLEIQFDSRYQIVGYDD